MNSPAGITISFSVTLCPQSRLSSICCFSGGGWSAARTVAPHKRISTVAIRRLLMHLLIGLFQPRPQATTNGVNIQRPTLNSEHRTPDTENPRSRNSAIGFAAVTDGDDLDRLGLFIDHIEHSVIADADAILILTV